MKLVVTKAWCLAAARSENSAEVGAGIVAVDPEPTTTSEALGHETAAEATMLAFGRAIHLLRRQQAMTVEKLAESAQIDLGELVKIENDPHHRAEPRAVSQLARIFRQDPKTFQQLAGNAMVRDRRMVEEAERFAARSGSIEKLSSQERQALEHFIAALGALSEKRSKPKP